MGHRNKISAKGTRKNQKDRIIKFEERASDLIITENFYPFFNNQHSNYKNNKK